ncbi:MAG: ISNCY family transposase [Candidatus Latescibacterota bacterium]|nr:MAG: ISNCY family transposase [Candidatus Latescibacterota bacterium]
MAKEDILTMRSKELVRLHMIKKVVGGDVRQVEAAEVLGLSDRQVRRLIRRVEDEGDRGVIHRGRGRSSNRAYPESLKRKVISLYSKKYGDFGPTLFVEKLSEREGIDLGFQTVRNWLIEAGVWERRRRARRHRRWRERKRYRGEMVQVDGSHHDWLEDRGPELVLMGYIDDATNRVMARFYDYEGTLPAMDSFRRYARRYGLPMSLYLDKHATYKSMAKSTIEDRLAGRRPQSQFERAMRELGVQVIHAHSPQAKGRVERLFRTFQDRLVKEMRLDGIATKDEANRFLGKYLAVHNRWYSREAQGDVHRPVPQGVDLSRVLCIRAKRGVRNDGTIAHNKTVYQLLESIRPRHIFVEERLDGRLYVTHRGESLKYRKLAAAPAKTPQPKTRAPRKGNPRGHRPSADHPWKRPLLVPR